GTDRVAGRAALDGAARGREAEADADRVLRARAAVEVEQAGELHVRAVAVPGRRAGGGHRRAERAGRTAAGAAGRDVDLEVSRSVEVAGGQIGSARILEADRRARCREGGPE